MLRRTSRVSRSPPFSPPSEANPFSASPAKQFSVLPLGGHSVASTVGLPEWCHVLPLLHQLVCLPHLPQLEPPLHHCRMVYEAHPSRSSTSFSSSLSTGTLNGTWISPPPLSCCSSRNSASCLCAKAPFDPYCSPAKFPFRVWHGSSERNNAFVRVPNATDCFFSFPP